MDLTTLQRVAKYDSQLPDQKDYELLSMTISAVSRKVENFLGRKVKVDTYVDRFSVGKFSETVYKLSAYPVLRDAEISPGVPNPFKVKNFDRLLPNTAYAVDYARGVVSVRPYDLATTADNFSLGSPLSGYINAGIEALEVTYYGGMAKDTAEFITLYPDIEYEVALQVIFEYKRRKNLTMVSVGAGGNSSETYIPFELRKELKRALRPYRAATGVA